MVSNVYHLRHFYIITVTRVFHVYLVKYVNIKKGLFKCRSEGCIRMIVAKYNRRMQTTFQLIIFILYNLVIILWYLTSFGTINLTILHIISFHSFPCGLRRLLFSYNILPLPQSEYYII